MSPTPEQRKQTVEAAIREISHIATLPEITVRIIELVEDPRSTAQDLHKVISQDPALCSRILKVVNSSFYGLPGQIGSINRAIVMLGLNAVKNIAIAASLVKLFRGGELTQGFSAKMLWDHCSAVAAGCKIINDRLRLGLGDEAYLAGLIHDIGLVVEMQFDRNRLVEVLKRTGLNASGEPANEMREIEEDVFGANHQDFGAALCEKWRFPRPFSMVTGYHHKPLETPAESKTLVSTVYLADRLAARLGVGFRGDLLSLDCDPQVLAVLGLDASDIDPILAAMDEAVKSSVNLAA